MRIARLFRSLPFVAGLALVISGCASGDASDSGPGRSGDGLAEAPTLAVATATGMSNARMPSPGLLTGGQPTVSQFEALSGAGYARFISLRPEDESGAGWEEADAAAHGHDFSRLAIAGADDLTRENVDAFAALLAQTGGVPTVVYCASGNRVGAMLALKAFWLDDVAAEDALRLGLDAGMTRLEGPVRALLGLDETR